MSAKHLFYLTCQLFNFTKDVRRNVKQPLERDADFDGFRLAHNSTVTLNSLTFLLSFRDHKGSFYYGTLFLYPILNHSNKTNLKFFYQLFINQNPLNYEKRL